MALKAKADGSFDWMEDYKLSFSLTRYLHPYHNTLCTPLKTRIEIYHIRL